MEKYAHGICRKEMQRRWNITLAAMEEREIDCLILYTTVGKLGGAMMYLTDVYAAGSYPHCAVFSRDGIFLIGHGNKNGTMSPRNAYIENVTEDIGLPITPSMCYADTFYPNEMIRIIRKYGYKCIGLVGMSYITAAIYKHLTETLTECVFVNATEMVDRIKAVKSEYEIKLWEEGVKIHERIFAALPTIIRPGRPESEVVEEAEYIAKENGCVYCSVMIGSDPVRPVKSPAIYRNKVIGSHDYINFLLELSTPGGRWCELGRIFSFDEPSLAMRQAEKDSLEIQDMIAEESKPGVNPRILLKMLNDNLVERGYMPEMRVFAHSQGYDIVERPVYSEYETMTLAENMFIAIHPTCSNRNALCTNTDNYLIKTDGAERVSKISRGIFVIE